MTIEVFIDAFRLPAQALMAQRIPKKLLVEQGAPTAADKRLINDTLDELWWQAAFKPGTVGVPAHGDVIELALVSARIRQGASPAKARRLIQLIHRAIPYPVLLAAQTTGAGVLSLAPKRASLGEAGKWVVGDAAETHEFDPTHPTSTEAAFLASLALDQMPRTALANLASLYQGYQNRITALAVAQVTGRFATSFDAAAAADQREALVERQRVLRQLSVARSTAAKARQMSRRVELNLQIQRLQTDLQQAERRLGS